MGVGYFYIAEYHSYKELIFPFSCHFFSNSMADNHYLLEITL